MQFIILFGSVLDHLIKKSSKTFNILKVNRMKKVFKFQGKKLPQFNMPCIL